MSPSAPSPATPAVLTALRQATAASHEALEQHLRLDADIDPARYARLLTGFHRFLAAWEPCVLAALPPRLHAWFRGRSRLPFLQHDLQHLGLPHPAPAPGDHLPPLDGLPAAFGSLYVVEGSALGGQVIARRLAPRFGGGTAYFHGWGDDTGRLWRGFREVLAAEVGADPAHHAQAAQAAVRTFEGLGATFRTVLHDQPLAA